MRSCWIAPPDAPFYQVWAAPLLLGVIVVAGLAYLFIARPTAPVAVAKAAEATP